jgi:LDH2 family malate/lactate/ureidoglycolate dehydrogenase
MGANTSRRVLFAGLKTFCCRAYMKAGVPAAVAEIVAGLPTRSDLRGVETHGVTRLPMYIQTTAKKVRAQGMPTHTCKG